ncbi:MAG: hypothetical protein PUD50_02135, partial [Eubacteriales bacterium]|nr:hypothetical protein [Eubacteriales bacterium]
RQAEFFIPLCLSAQSRQHHARTVMPQIAKTNMRHFKAPRKLTEIFGCCAPVQRRQALRSQDRFIVRWLCGRRKLFLACFSLAQSKGALCR